MKQVAWTTFMCFGSIIKLERPPNFDSLPNASNIQFLWIMDRLLDCLRWFLKAEIFKNVSVLGFSMHALYLFGSFCIQILILWLQFGCSAPQAGFIERCAIAGIWFIKPIFGYFCFPLLINLTRLLKMYPVDVKTCLLI